MTLNCYKCIYTSSLIFVFIFPRGKSFSEFSIDIRSMVCFTYLTDGKGKSCVPGANKNVGFVFHEVRAGCSGERTKLKPGFFFFWVRILQQLSVKDLNPGPFSYQHAMPVVMGLNFERCRHRLGGPRRPHSHR